MCFSSGFLPSGFLANASQVMTLHEVRWTDSACYAAIDQHCLDRTSELRKKGYTGRRLGPKQMTTDTAVRVTRIVSQGKSENLDP